MPFSKPTLCFALLLCFCSVSCTRAETPQSEYGYDADYFMALRALSSGDTETAQRLFSQAAKKGSPYVARRAAEENAKTGTAQERIQALEKLNKTYADETSLLMLCEELNADSEYAKLIQATDGLDLTTCDNRAAYYRCLALLKKSDSHFNQSFETWCLERPFTEWHEKLYLALNEDECNDVVRLRYLVYKKDYASSYPLSREIVSGASSIKAQTASDIGKSFLYGSNRYAENANLLIQSASTVPADCVFYMYFYAGRLYEKANSSASRIKQAYQNAMDSAWNERLFDDACWYYLSASLKFSAKDTVEELYTLREKWNDPYYYDDFFETLSNRLISEHLWNEYYRVATLIDGYATDETVAKYSYIAARFIQNGLIKFNEPTEPVVNALFTRAVLSGSDFYYRVLASRALGLSPDEQQELLLSYGIKTEYDIDSDCEKLMNGYADFGLAQYVYSEWQRFDTLLGSDCIARLAGFLKSCADNSLGENDEYYEQSIRMASRRAAYPEGTLTKELLSYAYPRDFSPYVSSSCKDFDVPEYIIYALIRSESFFAPKATSYANAVGLTQLMESTAGDIARKLHMAEYDLHDAQTNIMFGTYYLAELQSRLNSAYILSFFSYNGGITRVRSWLRSAAIEFSTQSLDNDIFLEAIPYAETREYGRKMTSASAVYAWLYYDIPVNDVISLIFETPSPLTE